MPLSGKELVRRLIQEGWVLIRINGSHHILVRNEKTVTVPIHGNRSLGKGLEHKLLKETGLKK
jgi:predicted RNA binding protein YcfA (HicA-like mRNA interferase family)